MEKKIINFETWKIILACSGLSNLYDNSNRVTPYLALTEYFEIKSYDRLYYQKIYNRLLSAAKDFYGEDELMYYFLSNHYDAKMNQNNYYDDKEEKKLNYSDYCNQLIRLLMCPPTGVKVNDIPEDLYLVNTEDQRIITLDEATLEWVGKDRGKFAYMQKLS